MTKKRYFVTGESMIPFAGQPSNGYTEMQAVRRAQREVADASDYLGVPFSEAKNLVHIVDNNFCRALELECAI